MAAIRAALDGHNRERPELLRRTHRRALRVIGLISVPVVAFLLLVQANMENGIIVVQFLVLLGILDLLIWYWMTRPIRDAQRALKARILPLAFSFGGKVTYRHGHDDSKLIDRLRATGLIAFSRAEADDGIAGSDGGVAYELLEAVLVRGAGKSRQEQFRGLVFGFRREAAFPGLLLAARRPNALARLFGSGIGAELSELRSGRPEIDGLYAIRSDNPAAALPLLGGNLVRALDWLQETWPDGPAQLAFAERDCLLLLPTTRNYFDLPSIRHDIDFTTHVEPMIWDLVRLLAIARLVRQV
ncbi:MAG TPA: hypothetical protein VFR34_09720, partial [Paracoccaceae bacterium]|nr:hypothetical protein [Paracoccaceae bacterium]